MICNSIASNYSCVLFWPTNEEPNWKIIHILHKLQACYQFRQEIYRPRPLTVRSLNFSPNSFTKPPVFNETLQETRTIPFVYIQVLVICSLQTDTGEPCDICVFLCPYLSANLPVTPPYLIYSLYTH